METQISLRLPESLLSDIDRRATQHGVSRSSVIRRLLESALQGRIEESSAPYERVRDLVGSVVGRRGSGAAKRNAMLSSIRDRRG